ncbi:MAG: BlaI/MecI/CopY family transcriptional regulator [Acidobacteriota bacterium]
MQRRPKQRPTDSELGILKVLWRRGPSTVREVQAELEKQEPTGYTTVLKLLQIMTDKQLVERDESQRAHVYQARHSEQTTQRRLIGDLLDRAFDGSAAKLVLQALSTRPTSREEMQEIRRILDASDETTGEKP